MPSLTSARRTVAAGLAGLALAASTVVISAETAYATTQTLCNVNQNTWVRVDPGFTTVLYTIPSGGGFRIVGGPAFADGLWWWKGHGNGLSDGWAPDQNLTNCQ